MIFHIHTNVDSHTILRYACEISYQLILAESAPLLNSATSSLDDVLCTLMIVPCMEKINEEVKNSHYQAYSETILNIEKPIKQ